MNKETVISSKEVLNYLPHRYPFLLIDKVTSFDAGKSIKGVKNVTMNEPFFSGHFPGEPIMPGVLIVEALAQIGCIFSKKSFPEHAMDLFFLAGLDKVKFRQIVVPGDCINLSCELIRSKSGIWKFEGKAYVEDNLVCSADISAARRKE